jgi:hypothetical protein
MGRSSLGKVLCLVLKSLPKPASKEHAMQKHTRYIKNQSGKVDACSDII